jgi:hypothetical protein
MCKNYKIDLYIMSIPSLNLYHIESEYITCAKMEVKRNPTMFVLSIYDGTLFNAARNYSFWAVKEHTASISEMKKGDVLLFVRSKSPTRKSVIACLRLRQFL